jgi:pyrroline-5-carboxylate reductase
MNIAFIGCGNMARAIAIQLRAQANLTKTKLNIFTYTPSKTRALELARDIDGKFVESFSDFSKVEVNYWVLGFKPQQLDQFFDENGKYLVGGNIVSMLAAVEAQRLESLFSTGNIIRIMPNTPIKIGEGTTLFFDSKNCDELFSKDVRVHFKSSGIVECKTERELDILTTFSGCGPAYLFLFADTMLRKMTELGFDKSTSRSLLNSLFVGASKLMQDSELDLNELLDQVTSKGGVTIEAVNSYRDSNIYNSTSDAIDAAIKRTDEINQVKG